MLRARRCQCRKKTFEKANEAMMKGEGFEGHSGEMPFDGKRLIFGAFEPLLTKGR